MQVNNFLPCHLAEMLPVHAHLVHVPALVKTDELTHPMQKRLLTSKMIILAQTGRCRTVCQKRRAVLNAARMNTARQP